jgi:hypothetical protein
VTPVVGGRVRVRASGSGAKKGTESVFCFFPSFFFYGVFGLSSPKNAQKRDDKQPVLDFLSIFFRKNFSTCDMDFFQKNMMVFWNSTCYLS